MHVSHILVWTPYCTKYIKYLRACMCGNFWNLISDSTTRQDKNVLQKQGHIGTTSDLWVQNSRNMETQENLNISPALVTVPSESFYLYFLWHEKPWPQDQLKQAYISCLCDANVKLQVKFNATAKKKLFHSTCALRIYQRFKLVIYINAMYHTKFHFAFANF